MTWWQRALTRPAAFMDERCAFRCCGYHTASMLLNVDRYPLPDGAQPELKPLE